MSETERIRKLEVEVADLQEAVNTLMKGRDDDNDMFAMPSKEAQKRSRRKSESVRLHG